MIISLGAGGMTVRDMRHRLSTSLGADMSLHVNSTISDAVLDEVMVWQSRQLDEFYLVIFLDALRIKNSQRSPRSYQGLLHGSGHQYRRHQVHPGVMDC